MIEFKNGNGEKIYLSYEELAKEFVNSPLIDEDRDITVNLMIYLEYLSNRKGLEFVKMKSSDWDAIWNEVNKIKKSNSLKVA